MLITILAVTKAWDDFCIAGMNEKGKWIRPIVSSGSVRFWSREKLIRQGQFIRCGDVWEIEGYSPSQFQYPNHTEDFVSTDFECYKTLDNDELMKFLKERVEDEQAFADTVNARKRSLCLVKPNSIFPNVDYWDGKAKPKMRFDGSFDINNPLTARRDYIVKDCKWSALMVGNISVPKPKEVYLCLGLATPTPYDGIEYPQIIGLHTNPPAPFSSNYPD